MDDAAIVAALAAAVTAFEAALDKAEGVKKSPEPGLIMKSTTPTQSIRPEQQYLTTKSIFNHFPAYHYRSLSTQKKKQKRCRNTALLPAPHPVRNVSAHIGKKSSRHLWTATPELRARVQRELESARIAARLATTNIIPFRGLISDEPTGSSTIQVDGGIDDVLFVSEFPCQVYIQDAIAAVSFALDEYEIHDFESGNRLTFWVDASARNGKDRIAGVGVVYKACRGATDWITQGYSIHESISNDHAEALAIDQALHTASDAMDKMLQPGSAVVIYSDSQTALENVLNFYESDRNIGHPITEGITEAIMVKSRRLRRRGIRVILRWVPSHQHVPGNELADWVAKRAGKG